MIILDATTDRLDFALSESATTALSFYASYIEMTSTTYLPAESHGVSNLDTTNATIVDVPSGASTQRLIKYICINNLDNVDHTVTIWFVVSGSNTTRLLTVNILPNEKITYTDGEGWRTSGAAGNVKNQFSNAGITAWSAGTTQATSGTIVFSNSNDISFGVDGQTITGSINRPTCSWYQNAGLYQSSAVTYPNASTSMAVFFNVSAHLSADVARFIGLMTTYTTSQSTAGVNTTISAANYTTIAVAIYSQDVGVNSTNLVSVLKGQAVWSNIFSFGIGNNGNQWSVSCYTSGFAKNDVTTSSFSTAVTSARYVITDNSVNYSAWSSVRFLDVPLDSGTNILTRGGYWLVLGHITSTASNATQVSAFTSAGVRTSAIYCNSQANINIGCLNSTNRSTGQWLAGTYTTNSTGIQGTIPLSAIIWTSSNPVVVFQLMGSNANV